MFNFFRNQPEWLYNSLPPAYLLVGTGAIVFVRNAVGLASGMLLIAAAIVIFTLRRVSRARIRDAEMSRLSTFLAPPSRLAATTQFVREVLPPKTGHEQIDRQHRGLASRSASLRVAFAHADRAADIELLIHELIDTFSQHLQDEVRTLASLGAARAATALEDDRSRLASTERQLERYRAGELSLEQMVDRAAGALVAGHLASAHPTLPSMDAALKRLRDAPST